MCRWPTLCLRRGPSASFRQKVRTDFAERLTASLAVHFNSVEAYYSALGNPFAEPASIQGNIPEGFGIFGVTNEVVISLGLRRHCGFCHP